MSVNNELKKLYEKYWEEMKIEANDIINKTNIEIDHPANPFLLKVNEDEYDKADIKVMIFGQETLGWHKPFGKSIDTLMDNYERLMDYHEGLKIYNKSSFKIGFKFFVEEIKQKYSNKKVVFIWNNISKIGRNEARGITKEIRNIERTFFPVLKEEVEILKPDIVVFFTGNRNNDIKFHFPDAIFEKYHSNATLLSKGGTRKYQPAYRVISKGLPSKAVKVYHPSYFGGFNNIKNDAIELLI